MRSRLFLALFILSGLLACRHSDGYAGGGFGPVLSHLGTSSDTSPIALNSDGENKGMKKENSHMRVRAYTDRTARKHSREWARKAYFYEDPPRLTVVGIRDRNGWRFNDARGPSLKLDSDADGQSGQTIAEWAPSDATYVVVRIVPLANKDELEFVTDGKIIEMEAEVIVAGDEPPDRPDEQTKDATREHPETPHSSTPARDSNQPTPTRGYLATRNSTTGSERGLTGADSKQHRGLSLKNRPGDLKGKSGDGSPKGHRHGSTRMRGGVRADGSIRGVKYGAAHGRKGGTGKRTDNGVASGGGIEIFGLVLGGIISVPESLKSAVDVANILGQNLNGRSLFKKFAGLTAGKKVHELRTQLAATMRRDLKQPLADMAARVNADKTLSAAEKAMHIRRAEHLAAREYFWRVEREARSEVERIDKALKRLRKSKKSTAPHHRKILKEQLDTARTVEKAAKVKPIRAQLPSNHAYAGGHLPLPEKLHAKYGKYLPFTEEGFPDFSKFYSHKVTIKLRGKRRLDEAAANAAAGLDRTPSKWTWHHHEDGKTMLLVPRELHRLVGHNGSYSIYRAERGLK